MAIENDDLFVLQKNGGGELRKASVSALLSEVVTPALPDVPEKISDLSDVSDTAPAADQVLKWDGVDSWVPGDGGGDTSNLLEKPGSEGDFIISEDADGNITYNEVSVPDADNFNVYSPIEPVDAEDGVVWYQPYAGTPEDGTGMLKMRHNSNWYKIAAPCDFRGLPKLP